MTQIVQTIFLVCFVLLFWDCPGNKNSQNSLDRRKDTVESKIGQKNTVTTEVNQLEVVFGVSEKEIESAGEFQARAVFTNKSDKDLRLNALFLEFSHILLKVRHADGTPVNPGSPPFPPEDDGNAGRVILKPGESKSFTYKGSDYFSVPLPEGDYQVRFIYENTVTKYGDWTGKIETDWMNFEVRNK